MTTQEIADYLEENEFPINPITKIGPPGTVIYTGLKGAYMLNAIFIELVYDDINQQPITKEYLDSVIKSRKKDYERSNKTT